MMILITSITTAALKHQLKRHPCKEMVKENPGGHRMYSHWATIRHAFHCLHWPKVLVPKRFVTLYIPELCPWPVHPYV